MYYKRPVARFFMDHGVDQNNTQTWQGVCLSIDNLRIYDKNVQLSAV